MTKRTLKFKVAAAGAVLSLPYLFAHFLLSGRDPRAMPAVRGKLSSISHVRWAKKGTVSVTHLNASTGTAAGTATPASAASERHLRDGLLNGSRDVPDVPLKKILFWNKVKSSSYYGFGPGREPFIRAGCPVSACTITRNRSLFPHDQLDAVVWHARSKDLSLPSKRIGRVLKRKQQNAMSLRSINYAVGKTKMAAWFVSNCNTDSSRSRLTKTLQQYISVDVYGKCGPFQCPRSRSADCYTLLERDYKFYLSFENSLCKDYVTEKFFKILLYNVVPVVYGKTNYSTVAPPHSFINVLDFPSIKDLAQYLLYLDRNDTAYNEYFWWKPHYAVLAGNPSKALAWCDLCERLHKDNEPKNYSDIQEWYTKQAICKKAKYQPLLKAYLNDGSINTFNRSVFF